MCVDLATMLQSQLRHEGPSDRREQDFLDRYVFFDLPKVATSFDPAPINYLRPEDFVRALERCFRFGIDVNGVEIFDDQGLYLLTAFAEHEPSTLELLLVVTRFCGGKGQYLCSGTFSVPEVYLSPLLQLPELVEAYRRTSYSFQVADCLGTMRIGVFCAEIEHLLKVHNVGEAYFVTAYNPFSTIRPPKENETGNRLLYREMVRSGGLVYDADAGANTPAYEPGFLVFGVAREVMVRLGREFGQNAVVRVGKRGIPGLWLLR